MSGRNFDNFLELLGAKVFSSFLMTSVHVLDFEKCNYHNNRKHCFKNVQKCSPVDNTYLARKLLVGNQTLLLDTSAVLLVYFEPMEIRLAVIHSNCSLTLRS